MSWFQRALQKFSFPVIMDDEGKPREFYHGTDHRFNTFEKRPGKRRIMFHQFDVQSPGHFFAENPENAKVYGPNILKRHLNVNKLLIDPTEMNVARLPSQTEEDLRYILEPTIKDGYAQTYTRSFPTKYDDWIYNFIREDGLVWDVLDMEEVVNRMKELGYDGTYVQDDEGRSIFVVDSGQIIPVS